MGLHSSVPQRTTIPPPFHTPLLYQWPQQLFRLEKGKSGCDTRASKPQDLLPLSGLLLLSTGCTASADSPCSSPLSPLHASRLACVLLCGEKMKDSSTHRFICYSATSTTALLSAQPSTISKASSSSQSFQALATATRKATDTASAKHRKEGTSSSPACVRTTGETSTHA